MNNGRIVLERLDQIGHKGIPQKRRHGPLGLEISGMNGLAVSGISDDDISQPPLQIRQIFGQTEYRHNL